MVIVPRIAAVSFLDTVPFLYGAEHATELRAELLLSDFPASVRAFQEHRADAALVPVDAVPALADARIVTGYCLSLRPGQAEFLLEHEPQSPARELFFAPDAPLAALPGSKKPAAYALWVAHADTDAELLVQLEHAFTFGMEHIWEAIVAGGYDRRPYDAYGYLTGIDYIWDNAKQKALRKFWDAGLKVRPRTNPG